MYLARETIRHQTHFSIRETYRDGDCLKSRVLFHLGTDPAKYIIYPGGKGYYFDEVVENALIEHGLNPTQDELDKIFWDFLDPEIQRVIRGFEQSTSKPMSEQDKGNQNHHLFDMRRTPFSKIRIHGSGTTAWTAGHILSGPLG